MPLYNFSFHLRKIFIWASGHYSVQFRILGKTVYKWNNGVPMKQESFAGIAVRDIGELVWRDAELFGQYLPVAGRLIEHVNKVRVFKVILSRCFVQFCKKIMQGLDLPC